MKVGKLNKTTIVHLQGGKMTVKVPKNTIVSVRGGKLFIHGLPLFFKKQRYNGGHIYLSFSDSSELISEVIFPEGGRTPYPFSML